MKCIIENKKLVCGFRDELKASQNIIRSGILFYYRYYLLIMRPQAGLVLA